MFESFQSYELKSFHQLKPPLIGSEMFVTVGFYLTKTLKNKIFMKTTLFVNEYSDASGSILTPKQSGHDVPENWLWIHDLENETREVGIISPEAAGKLKLRYL
jgi:hypothetical protein